jgi:hypothetical protein
VAGWVKVVFALPAAVMAVILIGWKEAVVMVCWNGWIRGLVLLDLCPLIFLLAAPLMVKPPTPTLAFPS